VVECCADDAGEIEARVAVEALVLDRDRRLDHGRGNVFELDREAVVAVVADIRQDHLAGAVVDDGVARERCGVEALDRGQAVEEGLGVSVGRNPDHKHDGDDRPQPSEQRGSAHLLPDRRPRGVNPRSRTVSPLRLDPPRYVSSHAWGAQGFYAFQFPPTDGKEGGLRGPAAANSGVRDQVHGEAGGDHKDRESPGRAYTSSAETKRSWRVPGKCTRTPGLPGLPSSQPAAYRPAASPRWEAVASFTPAVKVRGW